MRTRTWWRIDEVRRANADAGFFFFSPDTLRFFRSRIGQTAYNGPGGVFFTTSEQGPSMERLYSVRRFHPDTGKVETVGEFQAYATAASARAAARRMAAGA